MALHGKTTIARALARELGWYHQDVDELRIRVWGWANMPRPDPSLVDLGPLLVGDQKERKAQGYMLLGMAEGFLEAGESIILSAMLGEAALYHRLQGLVFRIRADLKFIWCAPSAMTRKEFERRSAANPFVYGVGYNVRLLSTYEQYLWAVERYQEVQGPHLTLDTSRPIDECVAMALRYIRSIRV